ncbi:MAG: TolC family protein [Pseudomonadota bacterium]
MTRAESQRLSTEALIPPLQALRTASLNRLATLTGQSASLVDQSIRQSPLNPVDMATALEIGDVEGLLRRRADIRAAEARLSAATARVGVAEADLFPRVSLVGSLGLGAPALGDLGERSSLGFGIGPSLSWAGFDRELVNAQIDMREAELDRELAQYEKSIMVALEETQTALAQYGRGLQELDRLRAAEDRSRESVELAQLRFDEGAGEFIDVLVAERDLLGVERDRLAAARNLHLALVDVHRALGAGWKEV